MMVFATGIKSGRSAAHGFTLIEAIIVVAIVGIIAVIAVPSYQAYMEETRRNAAQANLLELAQWMERRYSQNFDYRQGGGDPALPFTTSPANSDPGEQFYDISFQNVTRQTFTLQADPVNGQSGDDCGILTLDEQGNKGAAQNDCW